MKALILSLLLIPSLANADNVTVYSNDGSTGITIHGLGHMCSLTPNSYFTGNIDKLKVIRADKGFTTGWSTFDAMPGDYIKVQDISGVWVARFMFTRVPPEIAKQELAGLQPAEYCVR